MLLSLKPEEVKKQIEQMDEIVNAIRKNCMTMAWYMRGSMSYEDILNMSDAERNFINKIIESNLETTKKTQLPFF